MTTITRIEIYRDCTKEWRWHALRKGRVVAESGEGYKRRGDCVRSILALIRSCIEGRVQFEQGGKQIDV